MEGSCGNCGEPLARHALDGHYGSRIEIDMCAPCHLLWFDTLESVRLSGPGMLELIGVMARSHGTAHRPLRADARCPRCAGPLKTVRNRSRFGPTLQLECVRGHGLLQTFGMWFSEKGLWRALSAADRAALRGSDHGRLHCLNCGGPLGDEPRCGWCATPPGVIDIARLASALDTEGATEDQAVHRAAPRRRGLNCHACGAALAAALALRCPSCTATLAVGDLREVHAAVDALGPALRQHQIEPAAHVRKRRFERQRADLDRHREWIREMEANTSPERDSSADAIGDWLDDGPGAGRRWRWIAAAVVSALLALWLAQASASNCSTSACSASKSGSPT